MIDIVKYMNILVVGFGNMGCRHTQSLLNGGSNNKIWVVEPNIDIFNINANKIGASPKDVKQFDSLDDLNVKMDFAIVATSAGPRFEIVKNILSKSVRYLLLEKVVFQSESQFIEIKKMLENTNAKAYCNFVNRYYPYNRKIKDRINPKLPIVMSVIGGDFGLGCNGLHYIDLFEFLTGMPAFLVSYSIFENTLPNKRGIEYKEVFGQLYWTNSKGDTLFISSENNRFNSVEIIVSQNENMVYVNEENQSMFTVSSETGLIIDKAEPIYTSTLTNIIMDDIFSGNITLPSVQETEGAHVQFFRAINTSLGISDSEICPIT
jgi:predicted dehydrogenase